MTNKSKREVEIVIISDVHLGTYGCHAKELLHYLKSIKPSTIILNGDIIDIWQFSKRYWPKSHMKVVKYLMNQVSKGVEVHYITGNHDEMMRKFVGFTMGSFSIKNKLLLSLKNGEHAWIFHGDVFDVTMKHSKWLAKLGAIGYDTLILINQMVNFLSVHLLKKGKISLSKRIKNSVKKALTYINDFEQTAAGIGIDKHYQYVICGHIHHPQMRKVQNEKGTIMYLNSGDWIENLTALEYSNGQWSIYHHQETVISEETEKEEEELNVDILFNNLIQEFNELRKP
ncbi:UDP-2,3-diacylglucosamine diphosphatase [Chitinophagaceae bacterium LB-8]|uniref:UDP-2,3-diacylglucosamine diphosphatase n=1 Tax=Paraflavisolibacter caeni TaxID=2982496 RepID=A0A9X2XSJ5_9BACT|nr:UDP-2,3-diacylglucosamine diphosphatase [Paraflavisolibacter caeni]MCU7548314.1 UDP-2,3-diacylglucosamine diphosphatase [Paraflavisolibacter caeni]